MTLPHIKNSIVGRNMWEPIWNNLFDIKIVLPPALSAFEPDWIELNDEILSANIGGGIDTPPGQTEQQFLGTKRTFLNPILDETRITIDCVCNMNLRNDVDNVIYKIFRTWNELGYNVNTGEKAMKVDQVAPQVIFIQKNKKGDVIRSIIAHDALLTGYDPGDFGKGNHDHSSAGITQLTFQLTSDWWDDYVA